MNFFNCWLSGLLFSCVVFGVLELVGLKHIKGYVPYALVFLIALMALIRYLMQKFPDYTDQYGYAHRLLGSKEKLANPKLFYLVIRLQCLGLFVLGGIFSACLFLMIQGV